MSKSYRAWNVDQGWPLPASVHQFVPPSHLAHFVRDTVREGLDLSAITGVYKAAQGQPPYHPGMLVALLLYGYSRGIYSSRQLARACEERVEVMAVTGLNRPDFRTISDFRKRHLAAISTLFVQVLRLCQVAGLVKLGHVAVDGTKLRANASRHMPSQGGFIAGYNGQIAVDAAHQIIVAQRLSTNPADFAGLIPLVDQARANLGRKPREVSGDTGFATEANLAAMAERRVAAYLSPGRIRHGDTDPTAGRVLKRKPLMQAMADTIRRAGRRSRYRLRKPVVEPVFGHIKQARGFRQFLLRGLRQVRGEWAMICTVHNLPKLHKAAA